MLILIFMFPFRDSTHPNLSSFREGVIFPPYEGGLKVGADFNSQVSLRDITHPSLSSFREGVICPPYEGGLKVGADFNFHISLSG